jgi:anti-anti-sigma regulatory factor
VLRITRSVAPDAGVLLKLEGKLLEPWLGELAGACAPAAAAPAAVRLDLSGVTFVDESGVRTLRRLLQSGVTVTGSSPFIAALLGLEDR